MLTVNYKDSFSSTINLEFGSMKFRKKYRLCITNYRDFFVSQKCRYLTYKEKQAIESHWDENRVSRVRPIERFYKEDNFLADCLGYSTMDAYYSDLVFYNGILNKIKGDCLCVLFENEDDIKRFLNYAAYKNKLIKR